MVAGAVLAVAAPAWADGSSADGAALLQRGPVVQVEADDEGRFVQARAMIVVDAPPSHVFGVLRDMERYREFMPRVVQSDVAHHSGGGGFDVRFVYDLPGPDTDYTARMSVDEGARRVSGTWVQGDLRGSVWTWRVERYGEGQSLLVHSLRVENFSPLLRQLEDDQQTVTVGLNVANALVTVKAIKRRSEEAAAQARR